MEKLRKFTPDIVTELKPNQVFVFGSNAQGWHGAGSAGYALYGSRNNEWRSNQEFHRIQSSKDKKGRWAILGQARGFQEGTMGKSFPIVTVERPGYLGNVSIKTIEQEVRELVKFAKWERPDLEFLVVKLGLSRKYGGYSYFSIDGMKRVFFNIQNDEGIPDNIILPKEFEIRQQYDKRS